MRLILMRHAKSDWSATLDDHARPLNKRGRISAAAMGDWLRAMGYLPDEVLCSSAARTQETLDRLNLPPTATQIRDALYHAAPATMARALAEASGRTVLMVGHNPGIHALVMTLLSEVKEGVSPDILMQGYRTGTLSAFTFDVETWADVAPHTGTLVWCEEPSRKEA